MIIKDGNTVECNLESLFDIKGLSDAYNMKFYYKVVSPDGDIEIHKVLKTLIIKNDIDMRDLMDIINGADEDEIRQIIELLIYYIEEAHFLAKSKI